MIKKLKFIFLVLFVLFLIPKDTYAANISGSYVLYPALGNNTLQPAYDNNYGSTHAISGSLNGNWILIPSYSNGYYTFIKRLYLEVNTDTNFQPNNTYELTFNYESGSYIRYTNYYNWDTLNTLFQVNMKDQGGNDLNPLGQFSRTENSGTFKVTFVPQVSSSVVSINFTCITDSKSFLFWNSYEQQQGFKISSVSLTSTSGGGNSSTDMSETNEKLDSIGDTLIDTNVPDSTETTDFFEDLQDINISNPISNLITLPLSFTQQMLHILETGIDDGCYSVKLMTFSGPWFDEPVDIYLPCFDGEEIFGSSIWFIIDMLICFYMVYNIVMLFIDIYHDFITLSVGLSGASHIMNTNSTQTSPYNRR